MNCPTKDELRKLCRGEISAENEQSLSYHIDECPECQAAIDQFSGALLASAQALNDHLPANDSHILRERLAELKIQRPSPGNRQTQQFQDLSPWLELGDTDIGRVAHYDLIRCAGRGGMGVVFEAFDRELQRPVAVKMMSPALLVDPGNSQRFLREARAAAAINHRSVVSIFAVSKIRDLPYLVMELVEGESLQQRLERTPKLDVETIIDISTQLAEGLSAAHAKRVIHRDVKPANILIQSETNSVKLTDFGLAYTISENPLTQTGTLLGTPEYLAPEQIDDAPSDERSDLFSLATVIYHMGAGTPPFTGSSIVATLREVTTFEPVPLCRVNRIVPEWLSDLVEQLHVKDPNDRIADAQFVAEVLRTRGKKQNPSTALSVTQQPRIGNPVIAAMIGAILILIAILIVMLGPFRSDSEGMIAENSEELLEFLDDTEYEGDLLIEVVSDEPYLLPPIELENRSVAIFAGEEEEPTFIFHLEPDQPAITCNGGQLSLVGVQIQIVESIRDDERLDEEDEDVEPTISCEDGKLLLKDSAIKSPSRPCIALIEADGDLSETLLESESQAIIFEPNSNSHLNIESGNIQAESGIGLAESASGTIVVIDTDFETNFAFELSFVPNSHNRVSIKASDNRFECEEALLAIYDVDDSGFTVPPEVLRKQLPFTWLGSQNQIPANCVVLYSVNEDRERILQRDFLK